MAGGRSKKKKCGAILAQASVADVKKPKKSHRSPAGTMGANKVVQKSKEAKLKAAMAGGRSKKKKWSKGKVKEKLQNAVMFDKATFDKMLKEIPKAKLITPSVVSERLKVNG